MKIEISTAELLELQGWRITLCETEETEPEQEQKPTAPTDQPLPVYSDDFQRLTEIAEFRKTTPRAIVSDLISEYLKRVERQQQVIVTRHPPVKPNDCEIMPTVIGVC